MKIKWHRIRNGLIKPSLVVNFPKVTSREGAFSDLQVILNEDFTPWVTKNWSHESFLTVYGWLEDTDDFDEWLYYYDTFSIDLSYSMALSRDVNTGKLTVIF